MSSVSVRRQKYRPPQPVDRHLSEIGESDGTIYINAGIDSTCCKKRSRTIHKLTDGIVVLTVTPTRSSNRHINNLSLVLLNNRIDDDRFDSINNGGCVHCATSFPLLMYSENEQNITKKPYSMMSTTTNEQISTEEYSSSRHSTPSSSGGEKQFQFGSTNNIERGSGQNSRTSSVAESTVMNTEGFSNHTEIIQHLQTIWNNHNNITEGSRRSTNDETVSSHYPKGHSQQQHYTHHQSGQQHNNQYSGHQNWSNNYNPRRSGGNGNYPRGYIDGYRSQKPIRSSSHRSVNSLMTNPTNYQQQSQPSPPAQRRHGDIQQQYHHTEQQSSQLYHKKNRSDHDRRPNIYNSQQSSDYSSNSHHQTNNSVQNLPSSEQSNINSTQSFPSNLNSFNR